MSVPRHTVVGIVVVASAEIAVYYSISMNSAETGTEIGSDDHCSHHCVQVHINLLGGRLAKRRHLFGICEQKLGTVLLCAYLCCTRVLNTYMLFHDHKECDQSC